MFKLYKQHVFPHLLDQVMKTPSLMNARHELLHSVSDECLEIGFGTGLNLSFYTGLNLLYALEPNPYIEQLAKQRIEHAPFIVKHIQAFAENIPMENNSMKHIVSTWTMCSIQNLESTLREIHRVLHPDGTFHFVEHVLSDDQNTRTWQHILTPFQKCLADGCHLNRNIEKSMINAGFRFTEKKYFNAEGIPSIGHRMLLARVQKV